MKHQSFTLTRVCCIILFVFISSFLFARQGDTARLSTADSVKAYTYDDVINYHDSIQRAKDIEQMGRNMESFMRHQKEQEQKKKKQAIFRIGLGVLMLGILVAGLLRRRKVRK